MQFQYTILYCLKQLNGERTVSSIYYLLKGKRSSQTLQDGKIFRISFLFGVYKSLTRSNYEQEIERILASEWIEVKHENTYVLTDRGEKQLETLEKTMAFPKHLDGLNYGDLGEVFLEKVIINDSNSIELTTEKHKVYSYSTRSRSNSVGKRISDWVTICKK